MRVTEATGRAPTSYGPADVDSDGQFTLLGDLPCVEDEDPLGFDAISAELTELILASQNSTPFTLGINAGWGMGKSSLMRQLQRMLDAEAVRTVWFNAWTAEGQSVLEGLIKSVLDQVDPRILRRAIRKRHVYKGLRVGLSVIASWLRLGSVADEVWKRMSSDPRARNELRDLMVTTMNEWMAKRPRRNDIGILVVFIDDLDRCSPANVLQVFEAIKLYLDAPGFVFAIGYDPAVVTDAILEQKQYSGSATGREYLEKIVQITYRIQQPDDEQVQALMATCLKRSRTTRLFEHDSPRSLVIERNARNPRRIKRFINGFILEYRLDREWESLGADSLVKVQILQMYFPAFAKLFDERAQRNPLTEFLDYLSVRTALRAGVSQDDPEWMKLEGVFTAYGLSKPRLEASTHLEVLQTLEQELPESFAHMAQDQNFVSLVQSMGSPEELEQLRGKLERRRTPQVRPSEAVESLVEARKLAEDVALSPLKILWIDDDPERNGALAEVITRAGGTVWTARDYAEATSSPQRLDAKNLLISNISRSGVSDAGLQDVDRFRTSYRYRGPVIFYASRITPAQRRAAEAVGAYAVTSSPEELLRVLAQIAQQTMTAVGPERIRPGVGPGVFISYRRDDSSGYAGRIYDRLVAEFGDDRVVMDIDAIRPGASFAETIDRAMSEVDVVLAIIGPRWLTTEDSQGRPRLEDPSDFVRLELAAALRGGATVVPVLVEDAQVPPATELPDDLRELARIQALPLGVDRWNYDIQRLIGVLRNLPAGAPT